MTKQCGTGFQQEPKRTDSTVNGRSPGAWAGGQEVPAEGCPGRAQKTVLGANSRPGKGPAWTAVDSARDGTVHSCVCSDTQPTTRRAHIPPPAHAHTAATPFYGLLKVSSN